MKALTIQEAKEKVAVKYGFKDWKELIRNTLIQGFDRLHDEAALLYSKSCQEALKEKIAGHPDLFLTTLEKKDILNTPLIN